MDRLALVTCLMVLNGCTNKSNRLDSGSPDRFDCDETLDRDADGLDDCAEAELGTDPLAADSDGDGVTDLAETDCDSDPLDAENACGPCDWGKHDPGTLTSTGSDLGDTIDNIALVDQCGAVNNIWDFYGEYHVLFMTAAW